MTDKEKYEALVAEIEHQKEETSIGLNEWENGEEHGRMDVINALQEKIKSMQGEPANDDLEMAASKYVENPDNWVDWIGNHGETDDISYITKAFITDAKWQKQQMMAKAVDVTIAIPYQNSYGGYIQLVYSKEALPHGDNIKVLAIKEG